MEKLNNKHTRKLRVERFLTLKGFEFKANDCKAYARASFKLGVFLRKICLFDNSAKKYILKQKDLRPQIIGSLIPGYSTNSYPIFHLFSQNKEIAKTSILNDNEIKIFFNNYTYFLKEIKQPKFFSVEIKDNDNVLLATIKKDKIRYGKKNIYEVDYFYENVDSDLILLLTAFCDVTFFAETKIFSWNMMEIRLR